MNRAQAYTLVRQTFTDAFDKNRFSNFSRNLLNHVDESKAASWSNQYVKDAFKDHIQRYERLGTYTSPEKEKLDVLIVHLTSESKLERSRTAIRNFVADHLRTRDEKDAALVAFVSPAETSWRFSYIKMEYATIAKGSSKVGVETRLTPARRFSYIVGEGESCHTAQTRFLGLLQDTLNDPALADIEEAFSVEAVTKEFITKYAQLFGEIHKALEKLAVEDKLIRDEFMTKGVNTVDFAKKLMGQIVFLYFLQKKGWLGVAQGRDWGSGPRDFLRRMVNGEYGRYDNFFNDILEPLFYHTLATDRGHEAWCHRFKCRIPFLNGGLFEPLSDYDWCKTDIILPNTLFTNREFVEEGITGTGVLDVFDRYNFTVNEAEPLEKDVAIDPEMLGKVFENLIEANRRKGLGAYYTPREIVHYMCQESLTNYLDTALNTRQKSLVPGKPKQAKLFGEPDPEQTMLQLEVYEEVVPRAEIETFVHLGEQISHYEAVETSYRIKMPKCIEPNARLIDEKLAEITICDPAVGSGAFPVGMMTEIVRSRCALTPYFNDIHERTPYHFKRHAIQNCLYGVDIDPGAVEIAKLRLWLSLVVDEEDVQQVKPLPNLDYKIVPGNSLFGVEKNLFNVDLFNRLEGLKLLYFDESDKTKKDEYRGEIDKLIHQLTNGNQTFDFEIYFSEIFHAKKGFDVVIGNPPYMRLQKALEISKQLAILGYETYTKAGDIYCIFHERSLQLLKLHGISALITSNSWLRTQYGELLRRHLIIRANPIQLLDFEDAQLFESAIVETNILFVEKAPWQGGLVAASIRNDLGDFASLAEYVRRKAIILSTLDTSSWSIGDESSRELKRKIEAGSVLLRDLNVTINFGVKTGFNEAFVIDGRTKDALVAKDKKNATIIQPLLRGRDVKKYSYEFGGVYLINAHNGVKSKGVMRIKVPTDYPTIYEYMKQYKRQLQLRQDQGDHWTNLRNCAYLDEFKKEKLIWGELSDRPKFAYDPGGYYAEATLFFMTGGDLKYLLAVLNSRVSEWYFNQIGTSSGMGVNRWKKYKIGLLPIKRASPADQKAILALVERRLEARHADRCSDTTALEREIDRLVYELYRLTAEEIAVVEESTGAK